MRKIKAKKKRNKASEKLFLLSVVSFLLGFQMALCLYILSTFIQLRSGLENVGIFYFLAYGAGLFLLLNLHDLFRVYGKSRMAVLLLSFKTIALFGMALFYDSSIGVIFATWSLMSGALMWTSLDVLFEHFSSDKVTGTARGAYLTMMNAGFLFAPFISTWIVDNFGFQWVFYIAGVIMAMAVSIIWTKFWGIESGSRKIIKVGAVFQKMKKRKNLSRIYYISLLLDIFYSVMVVYSPIYLLSKGLTLTQIGTIMTVALIPFVLLQYPFGVIADKRLGEKELLFVGLIMMAVFSSMISFFDFRSVVPWMVILFGSRIGAATVEVMRDTYFYKKIGPQDVDLIDFFRTTRSLSYIIGALFFGLFLSLTSIKWVFLILGIVILTGLIPLIKLKDTL